MKPYLQYLISIGFSIIMIFCNFIPSIHSEAGLSAFLWCLAYFIMWIVMLSNSKRRQYIGFLKFARVFWIIISISFGLIVLSSLTYGFVFPLFTPVIYLSANVFYGLTYLNDNNEILLPLNIIISMLYLHFSIMNLKIARESADAYNPRKRV